MSVEIDPPKQSPQLNKCNKCGRLIIGKYCSCPTK
jgi:hypothetical protein